VGLRIPFIIASTQLKEMISSLYRIDSPAVAGSPGILTLDLPKTPKSSVIVTIPGPFSHSCIGMSKQRKRRNATSPTEKPQRD